MLLPYLTFETNCEEALNFYASVFGGSIDHLSRYTVETGGPALDGLVMHAQMTLGTGGYLSAADSGQPVTPGAAIRLLVHTGDGEKACRIMDALAEGGTVLSPLTAHPPPDDAGMGGLVRDRYGYIWILTAPNDAKNG